ncbi:MAG: tyrosine-type recombinase/integrase [Synergistota bacterium]|nr:tyrosine-type recombinase/integrase [Synergistota bacterium]
MLTEKQIKALKPKEKPYFARDDRGLYLEIHPNGGKYWRIRVWEHGKEIKRSLGVYPWVTLKEAREKRDEIKLEISRGHNPLRKIKSKTFREVALDWFERRALPTRSKSHNDRTLSRMRRFVFPAIGDMPVTEISAPDLLRFLRPIEETGSHETAHRTLQICGSVFRYAIATGDGVRDPSADLRGALTPSPTKHYPSIIKPEEIGSLLRAIDSLISTPVVRSALWMQMLTFVRPGELRQMEWKEIDFKDAMWRIPESKMKMRRPHLVPLSKQALQRLEELKQITGHGRYVFPAVRSFIKGDRPMSDGTLTAALRRLGYSQGEVTPHGFRSTASTNLHEQRWPSDAIERQLAHAERSTIKSAYNYAEHLDTRREMMQAWADWLDAVKES